MVPYLSLFLFFSIGEGGRDRLCAGLMREEVLVFSVYFDNGGEGVNYRENWKKVVVVMYRRSNRTTNTCISGQAFGVATCHLLPNPFSLP